MKITNKAIKFTVDTVNELLTITGEENQVIVVSDENRGGTFIYRSAKSTVNDGGVTFNGWCRQYSGAVTPEMFGAKGDGITDDTVAIRNMFYINKEVVSDGTKTYLISGSKGIVIKNNVNFNGSFIKPVNFNNEILIDNSIDNITLSNGEYFDFLINSGTLLRGCRTFPLLDDRYSGYYCIINTNQDFYKYRGEVKKRRFFTVLKREKISDSPLDYDMSSSDITSLQLYKLSDKIITIQGINFIEELQTYTNLVRIKGSRILFKDTYFKKIGNNQLSPYYRIKVEESAYIQIENIYTNTPILTTNKEFSYTLTMEDSYELTIINMNSDGEGWGSVGNNNCSRVTFKSCRLNRIDFHNPYRDYLKILDSIIGDWGVGVSGIGDLIIDNCEFLSKEGIVATIISIRSDVGFVDGNLRLTNCVYSGGGARSYSFINASLDTGSGVVVGSPITQRVFKNIFIDRFTDDTNSTRSYSLIAVTTPNVFISPEYIEISNYRTNTGSISILFNFDNFISNQNIGFVGVLPNYYPYSTVVNVNDCNFNAYYFTGRGINHYLNVNVTRCTGGKLNSASFFIQSMGAYNIDKCAIKTISTSYNSYIAEDYLDIKVQNSLINNPSASLISFDETKDQEIRLLNNTIFYREANHPTQIGKCTDLGNKIINRL